MTAVIHDPVTRFIAQALAIVVVSRLLGLVMRRISQPLVIAEIVAGILLGPSLLGWAAPEVSAAVFAPSSFEVLRLISDVGLVLFMFLVGLELDPRLLVGRTRASFFISYGGILVPFGLAILLALWMHPRFAENGTGFTSFALFLGAAMSITAFPVLARILTERRLLRTRMGAVVIACAAVDDVTAWCILAFVVATARSTGIEDALTTTVLAFAYIVTMVFLLRPVLQRLAARVATPESMTQNVVAVVLVLVLLSSWATELIGIHALFGAFLLGAILPKDGGFARGLAEKVEDLVVVLLLPLFFAYSGLRTEIGLLDSWYDWAVCGLVIAVACAGKFGGCAIPARLTGLSWREASALGVLMNTRGLMELIVLNIGLDLGVISPTVFSMMIVMALFTTFITTPALERIYPERVMARDLLDVAGPTPTPVPASPYRVLACVSHHQSGPGLVAIAQATGGSIDALHLTRLDEHGLRRDAVPHEPAAADPLRPALARAQELGASVRPLSFVSGDPADDICRFAEVRGADLVLVGWHKPVLSQSLLGGVVHEVLRHAPGTVGVFVDRGLGPVRRILVPFQGSQHDRAALELAGRIQQTTGAAITILHVVKAGKRRRDGGAPDALAQTIFAEGKGQVTVDVVEHASPAEVACERSAGFDLVIVGVGSEWGLGRRRFGLHPERLLQDCPASILVVRGAEEPSPATARVVNQTAEA